MRPQQQERRTTVRTLVGLALGALVAAAVVLAVEPAQAEPVVIAPAPVAAPVTTSTVTPVVASAPTGPATRTATRTSYPRRSTSCADAAMQAGRFDPSCDEYQGRLDPGTAAGREPTSGETQAEWACEQGPVPRSEC